MDSEIVEKLKNGDQRTVLLLYQSETARKIKNFVLKHGGTKESAEDVLVDAILRLIKLIETGKYREEGKFEAYFYKVGGWVWREEYRRLNKQEIPVAGDIDPSLIADLAEVEMPISLAESIEELSSSALIQNYLQNHEKCRIIFELRFVHGYSSVQIEKEYNIKHINVNYKRCIENLRKFIAKHSPNKK